MFQIAIVAGWATLDSRYRAWLPCLINCHIQQSLKRVWDLGSRTFRPRERNRAGYLMDHRLSQIDRYLQLGFKFIVPLIARNLR